MITLKLTQEQIDTILYALNADINTDYPNSDPLNARTIKVIEAIQKQLKKGVKE